MIMAMTMLLMMMMIMMMTIYYVCIRCKSRRSNLMSLDQFVRIYLDKAGIALLRTNAASFQMYDRKKSSVQL
ncbi:hypothetical protein ANTQUA_LOCUS2795 [Anthophora quadrimaculata]